MWWLAGAAAAAGGAAWSVRGRSSRVWAPSVWRGPAARRAIALTFDDGPSESTPRVLALLERFAARATFFQCGANAVRLPAIAREVAAAGHEIGNHTYSHPRLWLRSAAFIEDEIARAQDALGGPRWFRAPYGVRWPGLAAAQAKHGLTGAMWTAIGRDWAADAATVSARLERGAAPGAILCLHDGRELGVRPDIAVTLAALERLLPWLRDQGYEFATLSGLFDERVILEVR